VLFLKACLEEVKFNRLFSSSKNALIAGAGLEGSSTQMIKMLSSKGFKISTTDIALNKQVDIAWDLQCPPPSTLINSVDLLVMCSVLEHVKDLSNTHDYILSVLKQGSGILYTSVPWIWKYHRYDDDYHRFHASTMKVMFRSTKILARMWSTSPNNKFFEYEESLDFKLSKLIDGIVYLPSLMLHELRLRI